MWLARRYSARRPPTQTALDFARLWNQPDAVQPSPRYASLIDSEHRSSLRAAHTETPPTLQQLLFMESRG
ncbi:MAG: hypothetical protein M3308_06485 [Actinomycetota bacterium]|nr:hypothetical protein [Actinomycetota bacterium]